MSGLLLTFQDCTIWSNHRSHRFARPDEAWQHIAQQIAEIDPDQLAGSMVMGVQMDGLSWIIAIKMDDDWGYLYFRKSSYEIYEITVNSHVIPIAAPPSPRQTPRPDPPTAGREGRSSSSGNRDGWPDPSLFHAPVGRMLIFNNSLDWFKGKSTGNPSFHH